MDVIETRIDTKSEEYRKNFEAMEALVADLKQELKKAREERPQKDIDRLKAQGKLPVRTKLDLLLDKNTPFLEIAPLAARGMYDGRVHAAGLVSGIGIVEGHEVFVVASDAMIKGGAVYPMGVKKNLRCQTICMENRLPMVSLLDSAGAYLPLQSEIFPDVDDGGRIFYNQAVISKMGIPQITAVMGLCTAGGAYVPAMSDEVVDVKGTGAIFLGGPPLVKAATGEEVTADSSAGQRCTASSRGSRTILQRMTPTPSPLSGRSSGPCPRREGTAHHARAETADLRPKEIYGIVSRDLKVPYDCREIIAEWWTTANSSSSRSSTGPRWCADLPPYMAIPSAYSGTTAFCFPTALSRPPSSSSSATGAGFLCSSCRTSTATSSADSMNGSASPRTGTRWSMQSPPARSRNSRSLWGRPSGRATTGCAAGPIRRGSCGCGPMPRSGYGRRARSRCGFTLKNNQNAKAGQPPMTAEEEDAIRKPIVDAARCRAMPTIAHRTYGMTGASTGGHTQCPGARHISRIECPYQG